jgi:phosphoglycolate phosphatase
LNFSLAVFDLDGTLIDSSEDLTVAVNAVRLWRGEAPLPRATVASYVGDGAPTLIARVLGPQATEEEKHAALDYFIRWYHEHSLDNTTLYPQVRETIEALRARNVTLAVLTNKPVRISEHIMRGLGVEASFRWIYGGNSFPEKKPHPMGLQKLMEDCGVSAGSTLMVGDSHVDVLTARNAGTRSAGLTFGLKPVELRESKPDYLYDHFGALMALWPD